MHVERLNYRCLEAGCDFDRDAGSEEELVEIVQQHMSDAHDSFELEDVILANASRVNGDGGSSGTAGS
jgi:predicted small metal-binding protein